MDEVQLAGEWCNFRWFQASGHSLGSFVKAVLALVQDRIVVVTALDSGPLRLPSDDIPAGWLQLADLAISLKASPEGLPRGEWDEWYVFEDVPPARSPEVFVNDSSFSLRPEVGNDCQQAVAERFWSQIAEWWPESYLAEGDKLTCVTRVEEIVPELVRFFQVPPLSAERGV
jgi:hypothetical protein